MKAQVGTETRNVIIPSRVETVREEVVTLTISRPEAEILMRLSLMNIRIPDLAQAEVRDWRSTGRPLVDYILPSEARTRTKALLDDLQHALTNTGIERNAWRTS